MYKATDRIMVLAPPMYAVSTILMVVDGSYYWAALQFLLTGFTTFSMFKYLTDGQDVPA